MYLSRSFYTSLRANYTGTQRNKIYVRRFSKTTSKNIKKNNNEEQLPLQDDSSTVQSVLSDPMEKTRKRHPFPVLLPSQKEKLRIIRLNEAISSAESLNSLFDIYLQNKTTFDHNQYFLTTKRLSKFFENGKISNKLHENVIFQSICYDIWKITTQMEAEIVLRFYKNFITLGVSSSYLLMQALLQMMRHQINLYDLKDLNFMYRLLKKTEPCNLKHALQVAIPKAVENRINIYLSPTLHYSEYTQLLHICIAGEVENLGDVLKLFYRQILPKLLLNKESDTLNLDLISLLGDLLGLLQREDYPFSEENLKLARILATNCLEELSKIDLGNVNKDLILIILKRLWYAFQVSKGSFAAHEGFLSNLTRRCVTEKWDMNSLCEVLDYELRLHYMNDELVTFIVSSLIEDTSAPLNAPHVFPLIFALAASNFPSQENHKIVHSLMSRFTMPTENLQVPWLKFALNLLCLNYVPVNLLKNILDRDYLRRHLCSPSNKQDYGILLIMNRALKALGCNTGLEIPEELLCSAAEEHLESRPTPSLRLLLEKVVEDKRCLISDVITPQENNLDHLIVLDEGGRPIKFNFDETAGLEGIKFHCISEFEGKRKIALVEVPDAWMYKPGLKMKGQFKMELKLLEKEGFEVLPLYEREIETQEPEVVVVYLREKLRNVGVVI